MFGIMLAGVLKFGWTARQIRNLKQMMGQKSAPWHKDC